MALTRPYLYYDAAVSICTTCFRRIDAKIVFEDSNVYMLKRCPTHGFERVLIADDIDYYRRCREVFLKPPEMPQHYNTPVKYGCPYDCGLCPDHSSTPASRWLRSATPATSPAPSATPTAARTAPLPSARADRSHARRRRLQRAPARHRADLRRRAHAAP